MRLTALLILGLTLIGCSNLVPATLARVAGLSPLTADPANFQVALVLPDGVDVEPDSAILTFFAQERDGGESFEAPFILQRLDQDPPVWRIDPQDLDELRRVQALARDWETADSIAASGGISINLTPCRIGTGPQTNAVVSILLRTEVDGPFRPLVQNAALLDFTEQETIDALNTCP